MKTKGKLLVIGGAEDLAGHEAPDMETKNIKSKRYEILKTLLSASERDIVIITSASRSQEEMRRTYTYAFERLGHRNPKFIQIHERAEADNKDYIKDIEKTGAAFFTGGDQSHLTRLLGGTRFIDIIKERYHEDPEFLLAGTSAGAMALSNIMITEGNPHEALLGGRLKYSSGLHIINHLIIDTHFIKRGRIGRLTHAVLLNPHQLGIGLGEDTALIIKNEIAECRGSGMVMIIDGTHLKKTNILSAKKNEPIYAENLIMHILVKGSKFSLKARKLLAR